MNLNKRIASLFAGALTLGAASFVASGAMAGMTPTTVDPATETLPEEGPETTTPEAPADTPENDAPPPDDTPAERFEEYCNENPGACGCTR